MSFKVFNHDARIYDMGNGERIMPESNATLTAEGWKAFSETGLGKALLKAKTLTFEGTLTPAQEDEDEGLAALKSDEAVKQVHETLDPKVLKEWSETEKRPAVQKALHAQLAKVTPGGDKK